MTELKLYTANVEDIDDGEEKGKIQIRVLPEMIDFKKDNLPWAIPFMSKVTTESMSNNLPSKESKIWVLVDKHWKKFYYLPNNRYFHDNFKFNTIADILDKIDDVDNTYKNIRFMYYIDGTLLFHNDDDTSIGFIQANGSCGYFDANGFAHFHVKADDKILSAIDIIDESITITSNNSDGKMQSEFVVSTDGTTLNDVNKNKIEVTKDGIAITDANKNKAELTSSGISVEDSNKNKVELSSSGIKMNNSSNNSVEISSKGITAKTSTASAEVSASGITLKGLSGKLEIM